MRKARDIVVIGEATGGLDAVATVLAKLPPTPEAAVCVVVHIRPDAPGGHARVLERASPLPVRLASDGGTLYHAHVYVAPPDHHPAAGPRAHAGGTRAEGEPVAAGHRPALPVRCGGLGRPHRGRPPHGPPGRRPLRTRGDPSRRRAHPAKRTRRAGTPRRCGSWSSGSRQRPGGLTRPRRGGAHAPAGLGWGTHAEIRERKETRWRA